MIIPISAGHSSIGVNYPDPPGAGSFGAMTADGGEGPPRQRNPRGAGDRLRDELIEAAVRVLAAHGDAERLSIRAVAAEAHRHPAGPPWPPLWTASATASARVSVIRTGITRPNVRSRPCST